LKLSQEARVREKYGPRRIGKRKKPQLRERIRQEVKRGPPNLVDSIAEKDTKAKKGAFRPIREEGKGESWQI